jgi:hypothetical protein
VHPTAAEGIILSTPSGLLEMSDEVFAFEPLAAVETLWARRWTLLLSVAVASLGAYFAASLLPKTWTSELTVQIGRVQGDTLENPSLLVRRVNHGLLQCEDDPSGASPLSRAVTAQVSSPDFAEVTLLGQGGDAEDVSQKTQRAADCIVQGHQRLYESARQRSAQHLGYLELELKQGTDDVTGVAAMLRTMSGNAANASAVLLLQSRLDIERQRLRELSLEILKLKTQADSDAATVRLSSSSRVTLIWPKPVVMGVVGGGLALALFSTLLLLLAPRRSLSRDTPSARANPA